METTQTAAIALSRLEEPFASKDVKWLVAATSKDGRKGRVTPYADPRAYTDRLNQIFTASGWTRQYTVHTLSPLTRMKKNVAIQTGKVLVTCAVTINGLGNHSGSGEEWADDENAMTSAEAQAFKRACSCFGLGRYFYNFAEMWVEINEDKQPKQLPTLPKWALPEAEKQQKCASPQKENKPAQESNAAETSNTKTVPKGPLDADVTKRIESFRRDLGIGLYESILMMVSRVQLARDIPNQQVQQSVLHWMESAARGMARVREMAAEIPETKFYSILDRHGIPSLARVPNFGVLKSLVDEMVQGAPGKSAA
jgi:hypothetical protein